MVRCAPCTTDINAGKTAQSPVAVLPMMGASVPVIGLPIANHDNSQHAPNENLRLQNLWDGIELYAGMISSLDW